MDFIYNAGFRSNSMYKSPYTFIYSSYTAQNISLDLFLYKIHMHPKTHKNEFVILEKRKYSYQSLSNLSSSIYANVWLHMNVKVSQITGNLTAFSKVFSNKPQRQNINASHWISFMMGVNR